MSRKYKKVFTVTMEVKTEDANATEKTVKRDLQRLADSVNEFWIGVETVTDNDVTPAAPTVPLEPVPAPTVPPVTAPTV